MTNTQLPKQDVVKKHPKWMYIIVGFGGLLLLNGVLSQANDRPRSSSTSVTDTPQAKCERQWDKELCSKEITDKIRSDFTVGGCQLTVYAKMRRQQEELDDIKQRMRNHTISPDAVMATTARMDAEADKLDAQFEACKRESP